MRQQQRSSAPAGELAYLSFDPVQNFNQIVLVGVGGTGAVWARALCRILYDFSRRGLHVPDLVLVDPDRVEPANVGRQLFTAADSGSFKAEALARRFSFALGLPIRWIPEPFDPQRHADRQTLLCGAVDNHTARRALCAACEQHAIVYVDAGNAYQTGQVVVGNSGNAERLRDMLAGFSEPLQRRTSRGYGNAHGRAVPAVPAARTGGSMTLRRCTWLPHVGLVFPSILEPEQASAIPQGEGAGQAEAEARDEAPTAVPMPVPMPMPMAPSCAEALAQGEQHLLINDAVATVAAHYCHQLLLRRPLTSHLTYLDMAGLNVRTPLLTLDQVWQYCQPAPIDGVPS